MHAWRRTVPAGRCTSRPTAKDVTGPIAILNTGGWQNWTTVSRAVSLTSGVQTMRVVVDAAGSTGIVGNLNWVRLTTAGAPPPTPATQPYRGTPIAIPGHIEAEEFDIGADGAAYHDLSAENSGGQFRTTGVDIEATSDAGGGYNVGWMAVGEWLAYSVNVAAAGAYILEARVAANAAGGTLHVEANGKDVSGPLPIPNTGGWQSWTTLSRAISLGAGAQTLRVVVDAAGATGVVGNLNWVRISATAAPPPVPQPYRGAPAAIPGRVEAEEFDNGGEGVGYHDLSAENSGGQLRTTGVDIEASADVGGGYDVGWMAPGEWLAYTVTVAAAGTYGVEARVAANGAGGTFHIEIGGRDLTGPIAIPDTGGWQHWTTVTKPIVLSAGTQVIRVVVDGRGPTGVVGNLNYLSFAAPVP
jgi:carbohydrate binding protein with CBM6 domain